MKLLTDVDGDEISLVSRAANRRKFLLLKGDRKMENDMSDILEVPWEREGALLDEIRKDVAGDEEVAKCVLAAVRLLKGVEEHLSPEMVEKLGSSLYPQSNPALNTSGGVPAMGDLDGNSNSLEDDPPEGSGSGTKNPGSGSGTSLEGHASGQKKADNDGDEDDDVEKRDVSTADRKSLASQGKALPGGSFPIENKSDLSNAIKLAGNAKDPGKARAFIARRAAALGATGMLPDSWSVSKEDDSVIDDDERGTVETHAVPIQKEDGSWDFSGVSDEHRPFYTAMIQKQDETASELAKTKEQLAKADDTLLTRSMLEKAARYNHVAATDDLAPILKEAAQKLDAESFEKLETLLAAAEERVTKGGLFQEMGRAGLGESEGKQDAESLIVAKANEMVEKGTDLTFEAAYDKALRASPELYNQWMSEHGMGV